MKASGDFVRYGGVLDMWGLVPGAAGTEWEIGRRVGEWLLGLAAEAESRVEVAFDYSTDFELLEYAIRDAGLWDHVRDVLAPVNVASLTGGIEGELAAEACYRDISKRGLRRHHALADALALRAAYMRVKDTSVRLSRALQSDAFRRLIEVMADGAPDSRTSGTFDREGWLRRWLTADAGALAGQRPLDIIEEPGAIGRLEQLLRAVSARGCL